MTDDGPLVTGDPAATTVRRVITGTADGTSVFLVDDRVDAVVNGETGLAYWRIWGNDGVNVVPITADHEWGRTIFPNRPEGSRVHVIEFPAAGTAHETRGEWPPYGLAEGGRYDDPSRPGMHWTDTVDVVVVLEGRVGVVQGDGTEKVLRKGDVLVQAGALHAWRLQDVPCRVVVVALGAVRDGASR